jgi:hypothetical protein
MKKKEIEQILVAVLIKVIELDKKVSEKQKEDVEIADELMKNFFKNL